MTTPAVEFRDIAMRFGDKAALRDINLDVHEGEIFGIIGPANSGKTTFLRTLNRMEDFDSAMNVEGTILFNGRDIADVRNVYALRRRIGVVFPLPVGLPLSVYENVAFAPRLAGVRKRAELDEIVLGVSTDGSVEETSVVVHDTLQALHGGETDFTLVIPQELLSQSRQTRRLFNIREGDQLSISVEGDTILIRKLEDTCTFCGSTKDVKAFKGKGICRSCRSQLG